MSVAMVLAGMAAACAAMGLWNLLASVPAAAVGAQARQTLAPWTRLGAEGIAPAPSERLRLAVMVSVLAAMVAAALAGLVTGLAVLAAAPVAVGQGLVVVRRRWRERAAAGSADVARALADAVGAGHSPRGAIAQASADGGVSGAAGHELQRMGRRIALGEPTEAALSSWRDRLDDSRVDTIVAAVLLQQRAGGDLAGLLREIAQSLEAQTRARAQAQSAMTQAKSTARLVGGLPVAGLAFAELIAPGYVRELVSEPVSALLVGAALVLQVLAAVLIGKIARLPQ